MSEVYWRINPTIVGFTGSRKGMSDPQRKAVWRFLRRVRLKELHHGDCVGADDEVHKLACLLGYGDRIVRHPCNIPFMQAGNKDGKSNPIKPPLDRNKDIVRASRILIATPLEQEEITRSGSWSTVRFARYHTQGKCAVYVFLRNGKFLTYNTLADEVDFLTTMLQGVRE